MQAAVRRARIEEYETLCALWAEVDNLHADALPRLFRRIDGPARSRDYVAQLLADEDAAVFVAAIGGELVGLLTAEVHTAPAHPMFMPRSWVVIQDITVRSTHRRQGIGQALMDAVYRWARERGIADVELTVWEFNDEARAFYEALGYRTISRCMLHTLG